MNHRISSLLLLLSVVLFYVCSIQASAISDIRIYAFTRDGTQLAVLSDAAPFSSNVSTYTAQVPLNYILIGFSGTFVSGTVVQLTTGNTVEQLRNNVVSNEYLLDPTEHDNTFVVSSPTSRYVFNLLPTQYVTNFKVDGVTVPVHFNQFNYTANVFNYVTEANFSVSSIYGFTVSPDPATTPLSVGDNWFIVNSTSDGIYYFNVIRLAPLSGSWQFYGPVFCQGATDACGVAGVYSRKQQCLATDASGISIIDPTELTCVGIPQLPPYSTAQCTSYSSSCIPSFVPFPHDILDTTLPNTLVNIPSFSRGGSCSLRWPDSSIYRWLIIGGVDSVADPLALSGVISLELDSSVNEVKFTGTTLGFGPRVSAYDSALFCGDTDDEFGQNIFTLGGLTQSESVLVNAQDEENGYESGLLRQSCTYNRDCLSQGGIDDVSTAWERYIQPAPLKATSGDAYVRISNSYGFFFTGRSVDDTKTTLYNDVYGVNHLSPDGAWDEKERFELRSAAPYSPRYAFAAAFFNYKPRYGPSNYYRGRVLIANGITGDQSSSNEVWTMHLRADGFPVWDTTAVIAPYPPRGRSAHATDEAGALYFAGGYDPAGQGTVYDDVWKIDVTNPTSLDATQALSFTAITQARSIRFTARHSFHISILDNILFVHGGQNTTHILTDNWLSDLPGLNTPGGVYDVPYVSSSPLPYQLLSP